MEDQLIDQALSTPTDPEPKGKKRKRDEPDWVQVVNDAQDGDEANEILSLCNLSEKKRFLIRSINALRRTHPDSFERALAFTETAHAQLDEAELMVLYEILREECGVSNPYDNAQAITNLCGTIGEKAFNLPGLSDMLSTDGEIVSLVQRALPDSIQKLGGFAKLVDRILNAVAAQYANKNNLKKPWMEPLTPLKETPITTTATVLSTAQLVVEKQQPVVTQAAPPKKPNETNTQKNTQTAQNPQSGNK